MIRDGDLHWRHELSLLEASGRGLLMARARKRAAALSVGMFLAVATVIAAGQLLLSLAGHGLAPAIQLFVTCGAAAMAGCVRFLRIQARQRFLGSEALGIYDDALQLKDRLAMTAEFLAQNDQDGFHQAALIEARPWLKRARAASIDLPATRWPKAMTQRHYWICGFIGAAMLGLSIAIATGFLPSVAGTSRQPGSPDGKLASKDRSGNISLSSGSRQAVAFNRDGRILPGSAFAARDGAEGHDRSELATTAAAAGAATSPMPSSRGNPAASGPSGDAAADGRVNASRSNGRANGQPSAQTDATVTKRESSEIATSDADPRSGDASPGNNGRQQQPSSSHSPAASAPSAAGAAARKPNQDGGQQQGNRSQSQNGNGQQSQPGRGSGQGQSRNGPPGGEESGIKRTRGLSGMLLAVPMEDRLTGTINPGAVQTMIRQSPPRLRDSDLVPAGQRQNGNGDLGQNGSQQRTAQERRLLRRYFAAPGASTGARTSGTSRP